MSAQAVIPLEQVSATLSAGEADNIAFLIIVGDYLYGLTSSTPAKLIKIKRDDFATRSVVTFVNDGLHGSASGLVYASSTNRIYALFGSTGGVITEIHPDTLVATDKVNISGVFVASAADCLATDNTYLFVLWDTEGIELPSRIERYVLADLSDENSTPLDLAVCGDSLKYAGGYLYVVSLLNPLPKIQKINATNFGAAISGKDFPVGTTQVGIDQMAVTSSYVFVAFAGVPGKLWRFAQSDLAVTEIDTELAGDNVLLASDGAYVFDLSDDGQVARVDQSSLTINLYDLNAGAFYLRTMVSDGAYLYGCTLQTSTGVYRFLIPRGGVPGQTMWSTIMGGPLNDIWLGVTTDLSGNIYACGSIQGNILLHKYSNAGVLLWVRQYGTGFGLGVVCDPAGNVYMAGYYSATIPSNIFGGGNLPGAGPGDIFVVKINSSGALVWQKGFSGPLEDHGKAISIDSDGNLFVTGFFYSAVDFGGVTLTSAGGSDIFLIKLQGTDGATIWAKRFGEAQEVQNDVGNSVAADKDGNVYITGQFGNSVNFGGGALVSQGHDVFLAKYDENGVHLWSKRFGGVSRDAAFGVATDPITGDVAIIGWFRGTINFGGENINSNGLDDIFIAKLDSAGAHVWSRGLGSVYPDLGNAITVDRNGNVYATGRFSGVLDCGNGVTTPPGDERPNDVFVVKYSGDGTAIWVRYWGEFSTDQGNAIAIDPSGDVLVVGNWAGNGVDFGDGIIRNGQGGEAFLVKLKS